MRVYERARAEIPDTDLRSLAGSCGVDVEELVSGVVEESWEESDSETLDHRIDEFLASDDLEVAHLEIQLTLWEHEPPSWFVSAVAEEAWEQLELWPAELAA